MGLSVWQLLIIAAVILILFGRGKISDVMGDFGKGVKSFKQGMADEDKPADSPKIEAPAKDPAATESQPSDKTVN